MSLRRSVVALAAGVLLLVSACDFRASGTVSCSTGADGVTRCSGSGQGAPVTSSPETSSPVAPVPTTTPTRAVVPTTTRTAVPTTTAPPPPAAGDTAAARLGWGTPIAAGSDEFNYTGAPDRAKWGTYGDPCGPGHAGNGRRCAARNAVAGGFLRQTGLSNGDTAGLASTFNQRFGRWEVRARMAPVAGASGRPYHPVLILWTDEVPFPQGAEYDFLETDIGAAQATAFLHYPNHRPKVQETASKRVDLTQWHNYAISWTSSGLVGYLDGVEWFRFSSNGIQNAPAPMHQTIQLDNFYGGGMQAATFDVDWSRVYRA